jgi:uncharacterized membrane protein YkvA (DUF1232 family)
VRTGDVPVGHGHGIDPRVPDPPKSLPEILVDAALIVPHLGVLLFRLLRDPRVSRRRKLVAAAAAVYFASPIDVIPDFVPFVGSIDDLIFVGFAIHLLLRSVPEAVQRSYWEGNDDTLDVVRALSAWGAEMVPRPLRRLLGASS